MIIASLNASFPLMILTSTSSCFYQTNMLESALQRTTSLAYIVRPLPWRKLHHVVDAIDVFVGGPHCGFRQQRRMEEPERSSTDTCLVSKSRWVVSVREGCAPGTPVPLSGMHLTFQALQAPVRCINNQRRVPTTQGHRSRCC